jgi:hypothetical protein
MRLGLQQRARTESSHSLVSEGTPAPLVAAFEALPSSAG